MSTIPVGDHTPDQYSLPLRERFASIKNVIRKFAYPVYNQLAHPFLLKKYATADFQPNLWLGSQRGNDYARHRRRVAQFITLEGCDILVAGCGTARDVESWGSFKPRSIVGVDWFSYKAAWDLWEQYFSRNMPGTLLSFRQADLAQMNDFSDASFDVVSSDAVFEHVRNLQEVLIEFYRILRPGGVLYATFGPLWFGWGGDHVSGYDAVTSGYNHLILEGDAYQQYLDGMGEYSHSEHDGRTWIEHELFSKLTPRQYLNMLELAGFKRIFVSAIADKNASICLNDGDLYKNSLSRFDPLDLHVSGMTIIYGK